jgi:antitoxin VapB
MGKEHIGKSFRSGNSVAIRIPAALGVEPDREWTITSEDGVLHLRARQVEDERIDVSAFWGKGAGLKPLKPEDRILEERELDWGGRLLKRDG